MSRTYVVTVEYSGLKKTLNFDACLICLGKDGLFLAMDADGKNIRFSANDCKVEQIAAHVIIIRGYTDTPKHVTIYCRYE